MPGILVFHAIGFTIGIALGHIFHISIPFSIILGVAFLLLSLVSYTHKKFSLLPIAFSLIVGIIWGQVTENQYKYFPFIPGDKITVSGTVITEPITSESGYIFTFKPSQINGQDYKLGGKISIFTDDGETVQYGDSLIIKGQVLNQNTLSNPHSFDYGAYLKRKGIITRVSTAYGGSIIPIGKNKGNILLKLASMTKKRMRQVLMHLPYRQQVLVAGMLFGDKSLMTFEERNVLSQTGLMHAFAVSGLHVGFVVMLVFTLAQILRLNTWGRFLLAIGVLLFYAALAGFSPSVVRAGVMAMIGLIAYSLGEQKDFYTALAVAALVLLVINPNMLFDAGFQLSFVAAWGIFYLFPVVSAWYSQARKWWQGVAVTLSAQLAVMPLIAYYFNVVAILGIVINVFTISLVGIVVMLGLLSTFLSLISIEIATIPIYGAGLIVEGIWYMAKLFTQIPGTYLTVKTPGILIIFFYYIILILIPYIMKKKSGKFFTGLMVGGLICLLALPAWGSNRLKVTFLDVGQGDCIFIQTPSGRKVIIDGGGRSLESGYDVGERIVIPYLNSLGIDSLDLVINTHPHDDHMNGLIPVVKNMDIETLLIASTFINVQEQRGIIALGHEKKIPIVTVARDSIISLEPGIEMLVMHPGKSMIGMADDINNNSLVLKLSYGNISFLFTGDVEKEALEYLTKSKMNLQADVVKIPHHGSKNSLLPSFYEKVKPSLAVICVGKNSFGHPSKEVLKYWESKGLSVYRTDAHGAISILTDGKKIEIETVKAIDN